MLFRSCIFLFLFFSGRYLCHASLSLSLSLSLSFFLCLSLSLSLCLSLCRGKSPSSVHCRDEPPSTGGESAANACPVRSSAGGRSLRLVLGGQCPGSRPEGGVPSSSGEALRLEVTELSLGGPERGPESLLPRGPRAVPTPSPEVLAGEARGAPRNRAPSPRCGAVGRA